MGADLILWETHAPSFFLSDSFFLLTQAPPSKKLLAHKKIFQILSRYLYLPRAVIIYYTVFHVGLQSLVHRKVFFSFRKRKLLCWLSGKLRYRGSCTGEGVLREYSGCAAWRSWLAWRKGSFTSSTLQALSLGVLSCTLCPRLQRRLVRWRTRCYSSPTGVAVWS